MVFPAHAGMSRNSKMPKRLADSFPRSRGDEPHASASQPQWPWFSPLTRG